MLMLCPYRLVLDEAKFDAWLTSAHVRQFRVPIDHPGSTVYTSLLSANDKALVKEMMADDLPQWLFEPVSYTIATTCYGTYLMTTSGQTSPHFNKISQCCRGPDVQKIVTRLHSSAARHLSENHQLALRQTEDDGALAMLLPQLVDVVADYMELQSSEHPHSKAAWRHPYDYLLRAIHRRLITPSPPESYQYRTMSVVDFLAFHLVSLIATSFLVRPELKVNMPMSPRREGQYAVIDVVCFGRWMCGEKEEMDKEQRRNISFLFDPHRSFLDFLLVPTELKLGQNNKRQLTIDLACGQRQRLALSATNSVIFGVTTYLSKSQFFGSFVDPDNKVRITFRTQPRPL